MTIKQATKEFAKLLAVAKEEGESNKGCSCCGGSLPPETVYEEARAWDVNSGDCTGSVQTNGHCRAFAQIGW